MSSFSQETIQTPELDAASDSIVATGALHVEAPHWATHITVHDDQGREVGSGSPMTESADAPGGHEIAISLDEGIYDVEASLAGRTERLQVLVSAGLVTRIARSQWASLNVHSAAPLSGLETTQASHAEAAEEWSTKSTWRGVKGDSGLFLFVRVGGKEKSRTFSRGLKLLDPDGRLVVDLSRECTVDTQQGWAAFNTELPAGGYIIRRGGRNVTLRFQPIYLVPGWATQVFLEGGRYPRLHSLTLSMAPKDAGFRADDDSILAVDVLLESLSMPAAGEIAARDPMRVLLERESVNPWLGIVAAHALLADPERPGAKEQRRLPQHVKDAIDLVSDHPDARAILLEDGKAAAAPFWFPPSLRASLKRVVQHWNVQTETIPPNSLTDLVLDNAITNSPWTAWRALDQLPESEVTTSSIGRGRSLFYRNRASQTDRVLSAYAAELARVASAAAPAYYLAETPRASDQRVAALLLDTLRQGTSATAASDSPVVQAAREIARPGGADVVPLSVSVAREANDPLQDVSAAEISLTTGVPLPRAERGLQRVRQFAATGSVEKTGGKAAPRASRTDHLVLTAALRHTSTSADKEAPALPTSEPPAGKSRVSIEESVSQLRSAAELIRKAVEKPPKKTAHDDVEQARILADRLDGVADTLLTGAGFSVVTDANGRIVFGNGAFRDLVSHRKTRTGGRAERSPRPTNGVGADQRAWEDALKKANLDDLTVPNPDPSAIHQEWSLQRTAISGDADSGDPIVLNILKIPDARAVDGAVMRQLPPLLTRLALHVPLFAYGTAAADRGKHLQEIATLATQFEEIVGNTGS